MIKRISLLASILCSLSVLWMTPVYAQSGRMNSNQYRIETGNINFGSGTPTSAGYDLGTTIGQIAANEFSSSGYVVKAGFQYMHSILPFTFAISDTSIALGTLTPQTPATATSDLTVSFGGAGQYQVTAIEEGPLDTQSGGDYIPDTSCNGGAQTCTETSAHVWTSTSAYGFGYNISGEGTPADFINSTYFRPFPDEDLAEAPAVVMSSSNVTDANGETATVTYKVNISNIQAAGTYDTVIKFVATPSF
jgi:hypothetical protein